MKCLALLLCLTASALPADDGGQPAAWTKLSLGARSAALGQAVVALPGDAGAALLNPALASAQTVAELGSQLAYFPDGRQLHYLGIARPFWTASRAAWSLGYAQYDGGSDFERRRGNTGQPDSTFKESASLTQLGLSAWASPGRVSVGLGVKVLSHALGDANGGGVSSDVGLYWKTAEWLDLGLSARDVLSRLGWSTDFRESLPLRLRAGGRAHFAGERLSLSGELDSSGQQALRIRTGLEAWPWKEHLALRGGWDGANWSSGLGLRWPWHGYAFGLDYGLGSDAFASGSFQQRVSLELGVPL